MSLKTTVNFNPIITIRGFSNHHPNYTNHTTSLSDDSFLIQTDYDRLQFLQKSFHNLSQYYKDANNRLTISQAKNCLVLSIKLLSKAKNYQKSLHDRQVSNPLHINYEKTKTHTNALCLLIEKIEKLFFIPLFNATSKESLNEKVEITKLILFTDAEITRYSIQTDELIALYKNGNSSFEFYVQLSFFLGDIYNRLKILLFDDTGSQQSLRVTLLQKAKIKNLQLELLKHLQMSSS